MIQKTRLVFTVVIIGILLAISLGWAQIQHKDIIYTKDGEEYFGELQKVDQNTVYFIDRHGEALTFSVDSVKSIDMGKKRPGDDWESTEAIDDTLLLRVIEGSPSPLQVAQSYVDAGYLVLYEKETCKYFEDNSSQVTTRKIIKVFKDRGKDQANQMFYYFQDNQEISIDFARSISKEGMVISLNDNAIEDASAYSYLPEYQRLRRIKFALKDVTLSSIIDFQITRKTHGHDILEPFYRTWNFQSSEPVLYSGIEVIVPQKTKVTYHPYNFKGKPRESKNGNYKHYLWEMRDLEPYVSEQTMPPTFLVTPSIIIAFESDWAEIGAAYYNKALEAFQSHNAVEAKVAELIAGNSPNKLEILYNFVAENIEDKGLSLNSYYPYPKPLDTILKNGFGSQQDVTFLLWGMLKLAGIECDLCLFPHKTGYQYRFADDIESISPFQIVAIKCDGANRVGYLYPNEYIRYDQSPSNLAGITGLLITGKGGKLIKTPELPASVNGSINKLDVIMKTDGSVEVEQHILLDGTAESTYRALKYNKTEENDNYFEDKVKEIDDRAVLIDYTLEGYKTLADNINLVLRFRIPNFAITAGEEILAFNFPSIKYSAYGVGAPSRTYPLFYGTLMDLENHIEIQLPQGYEVYYIASSVSYGDDRVGYNAEISRENGTVKFNDHYFRTECWLEAEYYPQFKSLIENRAKISKEWVVLKKL
ncbi:DUF3857 domain-containing protein [bacterium]|nr:DUF3857 domain-containing protein [bacterium]